MIDDLNMETILSSSENAALSTLISEGIISEDDVAKIMNKKKAKFVEENHFQKIFFQESQGRWCTHVCDPVKTQGKRKLVARKSKDDLIDYLYEFYSNASERRRMAYMSIEKLFDQWLEYKRLHGISESTILKYQSDWRCHLKGTKIVRKPIKQITSMELDEWAHRLIQKNNMTKTNYINVATLIRQPLEYAVELGVIDVNPMARVKIEQRMFKPVRKKKSETQVYSKEELAKVKEVAWRDLENPKLVYKLAPLAFLFMFQTGLRIGEACAVKFNDVEGYELHVQRTVIRDTHQIKDGLKGVATERWVILSEEAKQIIAEAKRRQELKGVYNGGYIFSETEDCLSYKSLAKCFSRYCDAAGVDFKSSHKARKTFISSLIDEGMNINTIREMVGHADESTTYGSYCYDRAPKDERLEILNKALMG